MTNTAPLHFKMLQLITFKSLFCKR